ncbi:MAG: 50S ribosomal protein L29 [Candidatus Saccharimonadales bacterium]
MADKKTTTKTTKVTKVAEEVKTIEQLRADLLAKQADQIALKRGHAAGEVANPKVLTSTRKEIARLHGAIRALEIAGEKESK